ncbi:MAG: cytochrome c peroxidase [Bacteroidota bacterium]
MMIRNVTLLIVVALLGLSAFTNTQTNTSTFSADKPLLLIQEDYHANLSATHEAIQKLSAMSRSAEKGQTDLNDLQKQLLATRLAFKKVEFFLDYFDPYLVTKSINGAPLPKLEPHVPEINVIQPNGLQTLDELIFSDDPKATLAEIIPLANKLENVFSDAKAYQLKKQFQHRYVFEALRYGVIRVFTLGLTGFDTPGSVNAIPEAIAAMEAMHQTLKAYENITPEIHQSALEILLEKYQNGIVYLQSHQDFDQFDRLHFLTTYTNPIYAALYDFQESLNVEFPDEVDPTLSAHNYHSKNLFDDDFFNTAFYTEVAQSDLKDPKKIELGKLLFFDPVLSKSVSMSCASCHHPEKAFTDGLPKSQSNQAGKFTKRNAPTLVNSAYSTRYFWDLREYDLERQIKHVVHDSLEFNIDFLDLAERLKGSATYLEKFKAAYGNRDKYGISTWSISNALAAYVNSLSSFNSEFDQYVKGQRPTIEPAVQRGFNLFMGKGACGTCHFAPVFNGTVPPYYQDSESEVLGVLVNYDTLNPILDEDIGRLGNSLPGEEAEHFWRSFKTVTVRNVALSAPYMHNGGFETLAEVMDFYNRGGGAGMGLDVPHQTLPDAPLNLSQREVDDMIAFMESLTDVADFQDVPTELPRFESHPEWDNRVVYGQ